MTSYINISNIEEFQCFQHTQIMFETVNLLMAVKYTPKYAWLHITKIKHFLKEYSEVNVMIADWHPLLDPYYM